MDAKKGKQFALIALGLTAVLLGCFVLYAAARGRTASASQQEASNGSAARSYYGIKWTDIFLPRDTTKPASYLGAAEPLSVDLLPEDIVPLAGWQNLSPQEKMGTLTICGQLCTVMRGTDEAVLEQSPGWLETSVLPGEPGVCVIIGGSNGQLRILKEAETGVEISFMAADGKTFVYRIISARIFQPREPLTFPRTESAMLALVAGYPFSYVGNAPMKYVVMAELGKGAP